MHRMPFGYFYSMVFARFAFLFLTVFLERLCRVAAKGRLGAFS